MDIAGSRVLVTGGARRLGRALALGLAERGAQVAFTYHRSAGEAETTAAALAAAGAGGHAIAADLADGACRGPGRRGRCERARRPRRARPRCVRRVRAQDPMEVDPALFADALGATLTGGFFCAQAARRTMGERGVIVFITDVAVLEAWPHFAPHAAAKAALAQLTRSLARAFAPDVRVCAVAPGPVLLPDGSDDAVARAAGEPHGARPPWRAADVVGAVAYLIEADYVTGEQLVVDGGHAL